MKKLLTAVSVLLAVALLPQMALGQVYKPIKRNVHAVEMGQRIKKPNVRKAGGVRLPDNMTKQDVQTSGGGVQNVVAKKALFDQFRQIIARNDTDALASLLEQGADPNLTEFSSGMTPLMVATVTGARFSIVELLLDKGADKNAKDHLGKTAADYAQMRAQATVALLNGEESPVLSEVRVIIDKETEDPVYAGPAISVDQAYQILGVFPEDHAREIEVAYRSALMKLHPDKQADKSAEEQAAVAQQLKRVQEAYRVITQSRTKAK